jgi:hypothetical protein
MKRKTLLPLFIVTLAACSPKNFEALQKVATDTSNSIGCASFESKTWDSVQGYLQEQNSIPNASELKDHLKLSLKDIKAPAESLSEEKLNILAQDFEELFEILLKEVPQSENTTDAETLLDLLSALELGDHTSDSKMHLQDRIEAQFTKIKNQVSSMDVQCAEPPEKETPAAGIQSPLSPPVFGIRFTLATAYQSCQALDEPVMSAATADINSDAVKVTGLHPDGIGNKRVIANVSSLVHSHPYYKNVNSYDSRCLNAQVYPMIYDYGGRPYTASGSSVINLFRNAGSGTSALGMDCSGFVYTGLAAAGLRLSPGKNMKATGVKGINSRMFVEPQKNGMSCLQKITLTPKSDLKAGDIVAVPGHVLMIDSAGRDPFGTNGIKTAAECAKLQAKDFDFAVIQSSPSKNAVGMNRYIAKDYLYEADKMRAGLEKYAYYACLAKVNNKTYTPNLGTASIIRHRMTSDCLGRRVELSHQSCVSGCSQLAN